MSQSNNDIKAYYRGNEVQHENPDVGAEKTYQDDWGLDDLDSGISMGEDDFSLAEDDFSLSETEGGFGGETRSLSTTQAREQIHRLSSLLEGNAELSTQEKAVLAKEISSLQGRLNWTVGQSGQALDLALQDVFSKMALIETKIMGLETEVEENPSETLKSSIEKTITDIKANENLSEANQAEFIEKLEKLSLSLDSLSEEDSFEIEERFETIKAEFNEKSLYPRKVGDLAELTGADPEQIEKLLKKHNLDIKNLPKPPDGKVAALLNDPELSSNLTSLVSDAEGKSKELKEQITSMTAMAHSINQANESSDTSNKDSVDWSPYKFLYNAKFHYDDFSEGLINARQKVATEMASVLSALYGEKVSANDDPKKAGMIEFNGSDINVLSDGGNSEIDFGRGKPEWPSVDLVKVFVDDEGDGMTSIPGWMSETHYPYHRYDTGSHRWTYNDSNQSDVGHAV